ncbi:MAG: hypothetical protein PHQ12_00750 [Chthoniobacteraceae bacterium]|nr:hypothetical protein [Chthoniobacteraceae bacterium]
MPAILNAAPITAHAVTKGPQHHFFGYYDKFPWDASGRWMLGMESSFMDRPPTENDILTIGLIDTACDNQWTPLAQSHSWNWQQGAMAQWLGDGTSGDIIFNDRVEGRLVARILNVHTKAERMLDTPIYAVNRAGTHAVSINFARLHSQRPGYGYPGVPDPWKDVAEPEEDGVFSLDLATGEKKLILSTAQAANYLRKPEFDGKIHRFNHAQFSHHNGRFACLHRYKTPDEEVGSTRLLTLNLDGSDLCCLSDHTLVSHYDWKDDRSVLAWARREGRGDHYYLFHDRSDRVDVIGEKVFRSDGHCSFSPDGKWVLTDTYPDSTNHRTLLLFHLESGELIELGRFFTPPVTWQIRQIRCDLHPRWSRDGEKVCIDSIHEGSRQIYVLDVKSIVKNTR